MVHYGVYANAAYGWKGRLFSRFRLHRSDVTAIPASLRAFKSTVDVVYVSSKAKKGSPMYFIAKDRERKTIVLTIRGTLSLEDCFTDLDVELEGFEKEEKGGIKEWFGMGGKYLAHGGMLEGAKSISIQARRRISALLAVHTDYTLVITGHSLGAGVASILGSLWSSTFPSLLVFAYGVPCIAPLSCMPTTSENVVSVVNTGDPFATMSVGHLEDVVKGLTWLAERREVREEVIEAISRGGKGGNHVTERVIKEIREVMNSEKYYPPGRVYEIREMEGGRVEMWKVGQERWKEMVLQYNMLDIPKHVPFLYEDLLKRLSPCDVTKER
ncbi:hypothetical protein TrCOL_g10224 [Triparma columacea]|uniref:sn-1-specific diacylglycerol lipase n=1 Tax=Triparma columacea TaxID=722753 RepID=A0A9W7GB43_9STRA|nr:hypothetical protein TrCOL_g10224 [Triparma columacea]